ncbi:hypothetical protein SHJG_8205 [Streptomyces hygroscopicus subsp. jinggangensis 5008]|nr:hypothetical protein SHJG_8205 [Streptomyces hygroscopicus subsp. jinggangensis 5008]AGF67628.1 hypothetical protein SHJGH_7966 [Streptomyces hygroscopicus subsp. jinggangensis TL01]
MTQQECATRRTERTWTGWRGAGRAPPVPAGGHRAGSHQCPARVAGSGARS